MCLSNIKFYFNFFSATWPSSVKYVANKLMTNSVKVQVGDLDLAAVASVSQDIIIIENDDKFDLVSPLNYSLYVK